nr:MAG TPA: hypothetical protein [Bacteriophage sp.]
MRSRNGICSSISTTIRNTIFKNVFSRASLTFKYCKLKSESFTPTI